MNETMKKLRAEMEAKLAFAKAAEGAEAKTAIMAEYDELKKAYEAEAAIVEAEKSFVAEQPEMPKAKEPEMTGFEKSVKDLKRS